MKIRNIVLSLLLFFVIPLSNLNAQNVKFKIMRDGEKIGSINAKQEKSGQKTIYTVTSIARFRVVFKYVRETFMKVVFLGDELYSSNSKQSMNDELKDHREVKKCNQGGYDCKKDLGKSTFKLNKKIDFTSSMLYFEEPKGKSYIFAESYQELCPLELIDTGIYKLSLPGDKVNHYVYKNGVLQEIRVFRSVVDLVFERE